MSLTEEVPQVCNRLTIWEIQAATQNCDKSSLLGKGGYGKVYRGLIMTAEGKIEVAIKKCLKSTDQGLEEFLSEIEILSVLRHDYLVSLIGYCDDGDEMILVYEYMHNGTLSDRLHDPCRSPLTWIRRLKVCIGTAKGLNYIHTGTGIVHGVVHRDVKSTNVLLDKKWGAKIGDFGLCKTDQMNSRSTFFSESVRGTSVHVDPVYLKTGHFNKKSDVYSFGVMMLEVLSGKKPQDISQNQGDLFRWIQGYIENNSLEQIVDSTLKQTISVKCLKRFAQLAARCLDTDSTVRPTMEDVAAGLESILNLQNESNNKSVSKKFGKKMPDLFSLNRVEGTRLKSLKLFFYTVGGEDQILHRFDLNTVKFATGNFSEANKISEDNFGTMYKGQLPTGQDIAVYEFSRDTRHELLKNQVSIVVKLEHKNLVQLAGYCIKEKMVYLLYDFAPYKTLDGLIFDPNGASLSWNRRYKIILGVARVLAYLHKDAPVRVIHFDVKPHNIMLDGNLDPKLSGFYFARSLAMNESDHIEMDEVHGTKSYLAPECTNLSAGRIHSAKCDVFGFGVLVLEIITGRKRMERHLSTDELLEGYVHRNWLEGNLPYIVDRIIVADPSLIKEVVMIGLMCTREDAGARPTMDEVVDKLLGISSIDTEIRAMNVKEWEMQVRTRKKDHKDLKQIYALAR